MSEGESKADTSDRYPDGAPSGFPWERLFYTVGFAIVAWCVFWILLTLAFVQFVLLLLRGFTHSASVQPNGDLKRLNVRLLQYLVELLAYILFVRDALPYPFGPFPADAPRER